MAISQCQNVALSTTNGLMQTKSDQLETSLETYAQWLIKSVDETAEFQRFREQWPCRFFELCKLHLAVLIDLPLDLFEQCSNSITCELTVDQAAELDRGTPRKHLRSWYRFRHMGKENDACDSVASRLHRWAPKIPLSMPALICGIDPVMKNLLILMDALDTPTNLSVEGIFRKTGNVIRQRALRQRILTERPLQVNSLFDLTDQRPSWRPAGRGTSATRAVATGAGNSTFTALNIHDLASGLKGVLFDLTEPLLTQRLLPIFVQVAALTTGRQDERGNRISLRPIEERIASSKQVKALRLLCFLLPTSHSTLLKRLLRLLENTLSHTDNNRMTAESLGTLFGPLLFSPGRVHPRDLHTQYNSLARLASLMITQGVDGLWKVPHSFAQDVERNRLLLTQPFRTHDTTSITSSSTTYSRSPSSSDSGMGWTDSTSNHSQPSSSRISELDTHESENELPALVTCINFTATPETTCHMTPRDGDRSVTDYAVAELCATVQSLPDNDKRKRRLIQRFNATNGGLIPPREDALVTPPMTRGPGQRCGSSPSQGKFIRATTGTSTFKAAKTIRSSLRRKLAMKSNISVSNCFNNQNTTIKPLIESRLELDHNNDHVSTTPFRTRKSDYQHIPSPVFDAVSTLDQFPPTCSDESFSLSLAPLAHPDVTRVSLVSMASISSMGAGDLFLCCPLVEVIASPFRKRYAATPTQRKSTSTNSDQSTGIKWPRSGACKRLRVPSDPRPRELESPQVESSTVSRLPDDEIIYSAITPLRPPTTVQKSILSFGYRTMAHTSSSVLPGSGLRRVQTMPTLFKTPVNDRRRTPDNRLSDATPVHPDHRS